MTAGKSQDPAGKAVEYSPSAAKLLRHCEKKYFLRWITNRKQGWRKGEGHILRRLFVLGQAKHRSMWAGHLYHQVMSWSLTGLRRRGWPGTQASIALARDLAAVQFQFSAGGQAATATKSHGPYLQGLSVFYSLFDHAYGLPDDHLLEDTQEAVSGWLATTFSWPDWPELQEMVRRASGIYVEPQNLQYQLCGARVSARMDLGLEILPRRFVIYDWKCRRDSERFAEHDHASDEHQLLAYSLWPALRQRAPLRLEQVEARVFNPTSGEKVVMAFTEADRADFELEIARWVRLHAEPFPDLSEFDFEDLSGPYSAERSCPRCEFKAVCREDIAWHELT